MLLFSTCVLLRLFYVGYAVMFMRANIVGTVIVLSLVIWIPASCIVAYIVSILCSVHSVLKRLWQY